MFIPSCSPTLRLSPLAHVLTLFASLTPLLNLPNFIGRTDGWRAYMKHVLQKKVGGSEGKGSDVFLPQVHM